MTPRGFSDNQSFVKLVLALAALTTLVFLIRYVALIQAGGAIPFEDFVFFTTAAQHVAAGNISAVYSPETARHYLDTIVGALPGRADAGGRLTDHPFVYPPPMLLLLWPLGSLTYLQAVIAWFGLGALAFLAALLALPKSYAPPRKQLAVLAIAAPSLLISVLSGQTGLITGALLIIGLANIEKRPVLSGCALGALIIKPHLAMLVPIALLAGRHWRVMATTALSAAALMAVTYYLWGQALWHNFFSILPLQAKLIEIGHPRMMQMMVSFYSSAREFGLSHHAALWLQLPWLLLAAIAVWQTFHRCKDVVLCGALLIAATFVASPYVFVYDMPALALPLLYVAASAWKNGLNQIERLLLALGCFIPLVAFQLNGMHIPAAIMADIGLMLVLWKRVRSA